VVGEFTTDDPAEWNRDALKTQLQGMIPTLTAEELAVVDESRDAQALGEQLIQLAEEHYHRKREELGDEAAGSMERIVLLRVIDSLWVEHLTEVDDMRKSIGLRAYSQRDPLNEFKVEAFRMFDGLKTMIRRDVARVIFRATVMRQPAVSATRMIESRPDGSNGNGAGAATGGAGVATATAGAAGARQPTRTGAKIGRNDPCYCGSGKKYKRCHGA
jgi:preprotein translocase subunit SecA